MSFQIRNKPPKDAPRFNVNGQVIAGLTPRAIEAFRNGIQLRVLKLNDPHCIELLAARRLKKAREGTIYRRNRKAKAAYVQDAL